MLLKDIIAVSLPINNGDKKKMGKTLMLTFSPSSKKEKLCTLMLLDCLDDRLLGRWIGKGGSIEWPARSLDLAPLDYFFLGIPQKVIIGIFTIASSWYVRPLVCILLQWIFLKGCCILSIVLEVCLVVWILPICRFLLLLLVFRHSLKWHVGFNFFCVLVAISRYPGYRIAVW